MHSCIYEGRVRHRRFGAQPGQFSYSIAFLYIDLDEYDTVVAQLPLLSKQKWSITAVCRDNHLGQDETDWAAAVRNAVKQQTGIDCTGPVRLLTLWSSFGQYFSPLSIFFCFDAREQVKAVVAEVTNTPWRERHCYVLSDMNRVGDNRVTGHHKFCHKKEFHVSPFLDVGLQYNWHLNGIGLDRMTVHLAVCDSVANENGDFDNRSAEESEHCQIDATLMLQRRELTTGRWLANVARHPFVPFRILTAIYFQALRLWIRKARFFPHPKYRSLPISTTTQIVSRKDAPL